MSSTIRLLACLLLLAAANSFGGEKTREWRSGTLLEVTKEQVPQGSTQTTNTDATAKNKGNKTNYSRTTNSTTTDNYDNFQVYTIQADGKIYIARERLLFPWSKPATSNVGDNVKFAVEKGSLYLMGDDGKQHKAGISKVSMEPAR